MNLKSKNNALLSSRICGFDFLAHSITVIGHLNKKNLGGLEKANMINRCS
jgi:hypothetical protein